MRPAAPFLISAALHLLLLAIPIGRMQDFVVPDTQPTLHVRLNHPGLPPATTSVAYHMPEAVPEKTPAHSAHKDPLIPEPEAGVVPPYYPLDALTRPPEAIDEYGPEAHDTPEGKAGGRASVRLWVASTGEVDRVELLETNLPEILAQAAVAAFQRMRFRPGEIAGKPVATWADTVVEYEAIPEPPAAGHSVSPGRTPLAGQN